MSNDGYAMNVALSKRLRGVVRDLAAKAHERELRRLLDPIADAFAQWRLGMLDTQAVLASWGRVAPRRRRFSQRYGTPSIAPMMVAYAIVVGLLENDEVSAEVLQALEKPIAFYRTGLANGTISLDEG
jgi:hypothetical protein